MARGLKLETRECLKCGKKYEPHRRRQRFDKDECRIKWHTEEDRRAREAYKAK